jgi:N-acetyl sugar amidotransferase
MDTSDPDITFDASGVCRYCHAYEQTGSASPAGDRSGELERRLAVIREHGKGRDYDAIIGVSGGVDSTYVALLCKRFGLRCLAVHLDNGWNSETAVANIEQAIKRLGFDLHTVVLDWEEFRDLQLSFLKASTPDAEIPSDHAIQATVVKTAWKLKVNYVVFGVNRVNEAILPPAWSQGHQDWRYIRSVQQRFGSRPLKDFPRLTAVDTVRYRIWSRDHLLNVLDYVDYNRERAIHELETELGWRNYGGKHYESVYTRFFQGHILTRKFGFDKRRAHLANQILAGHTTREHALEELKKPAYPSSSLEEQDRAFVIKKLGLNEAQFAEIMAQPCKRYEDYPNTFKSKPYVALRSAYRAIRQVASRQT